MYNQVSLLLAIHLGIELSQMVTLFSLWRMSQTVFQSATILYSHQQRADVPSSPDPRSHLLLSDCEYSHPGGCEIVYPYSVNLHFPSGWRMMLDIF